jgi:cell division protein ZapA
MIEQRSAGDGSNRFVFRIMGDDYTIKGHDDPEYMEKVASYLESTINGIAESNQKLTKNQVAILAALRISDELHKLRMEYQFLEQLLEEAK